MYVLVCFFSVTDVVRLNSLKSLIAAQNHGQRLENATISQYYYLLSHVEMLTLMLLVVNFAITK